MPAPGDEIVILSLTLASLTGLALAIINKVTGLKLLSRLAEQVTFVLMPPLILIFLVLSAAFTFYLGGFYERNQADLLPFFSFHPWLYLFLVPAVAMRLWSEERKGGTIELLLTLPLPQWQAVVGKFLAAWAFCAIALLLAQHYRTSPP